MQCTPTILPDSFSNQSIIFDWIKEGRAYYSRDYKEWKPFPKDLPPNFIELSGAGIAFKAEWRPAPPKFKLCDYVVTYDNNPSRRFVGHVTSITSISGMGHTYTVEEFGERANDVPEERIKLFEYKNTYKFNLGDRVVLNAPRMYHHGKTGEVIFKFGNGDYRVKFDGHPCEHRVEEGMLTLAPQTPKFKVGDHIIVLEASNDYHQQCGVIEFLNKTRGCYNVRFDDGKEKVMREVSLALIPPVKDDSAIKWAEGLITQLPQTHGGRNSWLMNHGGEKEVITDPEAVATLLRQHATVTVTDRMGNTVLKKNTEVEMIKKWIAVGATFTWIRRP
jgi:hypothetical protein